MENNTISMEKCMVKDCVVCGLMRISPDVKKEWETFKGVPGVKVYHKSDNISEYRWRDNDTIEICEVCNTHIAKMNTVIAANKLSSTGISDPVYHKPMSVKDVLAEISTINEYPSDNEDTNRKLRLSKCENIATIMTTHERTLLAKWAYNNKMCADVASMVMKSPGELNTITGLLVDLLNSADKWKDITVE